MKTQLRTTRTLALLGGSPAFSKPILLGRPRLPAEATFRKHLAPVFRSRWLTNDGALVRKLEGRLRLRLGVGFCAAFCNGTTALQVALRSLDLSGEVITTPFTFPATVHAIRWVGLTPVFCDVDRDTYNLDVALAAELVSEQTSALLPVHVFGNPCDVTGLERLATNQQLRVIYDACHAFGVTHKGRGIGWFGDFSVFSFHATKIFHTAEGGAIVGSAPQRPSSIALLRNFGIVSEEEVDGIGINGKLSEIHAALGLGVLDLLDKEIVARGRLVARYRERLAAAEGIKFQRIEADTVPNHSYFSVEIDPEEFGLSRDEVHVALRAENIIARKYFFPLCSENLAYRELPSAHPSRLPNAHAVSSRVVCLPCHSDLTLDDIDLIADCILETRAAASSVRKAVTRD